MQEIYFSEKVSLGSIANLLIKLRIGRRAFQRVRIDSVGGSFNWFPVYERSLKEMCFTTIGEEVQSAAIILYLYGQKRLAFHDSIFFFHQVWVEIDGHGHYTVTDLDEYVECGINTESTLGKSHEDIVRIFNTLQKGQDQYMRFIVQRSAIDMETLYHLMREETTLTAAEALCYGIVHEIISRE